MIPFTRNQGSTMQITLNRRHAVAFAIVAAGMVLADPALAQAAGGSDLDTMLQNLLGIFTGTTGRILAVIAVTITGVLMMFGQMERNTAGRIVGGILLVFGGAWFVDQIVA